MTTQPDAHLHSNGNHAIKPRQTRPQPGLLERFVSGPLPWLLPAVLMLVIFRLYPLGYQFYISMTDLRIANIGNMNFVGLANFRYLLTDPSFLNTVGFTFTYTFFGVIGQFVFGFGLALLLNEPLWGRLIYRLSILSAWVVSSLIVGYMWRLMLSESSAGVLNSWLALVGFQDNVSWLSNRNFAMGSVIGVNIWRSVGFTMVFMLGGLQTLPSEMMEAARVDGANAWQRLTRIIIPYLQALIGLNLIFVTITTFSVYEQILVLTGGGPGTATQTIGLNVYLTAFGTQAGGGLGLLGRGAAAGVVMFAITSLFALVYLRLWIFNNEDQLS